MTTANQAVLEKISKLLNLSKSSNPNEAANAMAKAQALMDEHRLEMSAIPTHGVQEAFAVDEGNPIYVGGKRAWWREILVDVITRENGCTHFVRSSWRGKNMIHYIFVGRPSDTAVARYLYAFCEAEVVRLTKQHSAGRGAIYANTFRESCAATLAARLASDHGTPEAPTSAGLVVRTLAEQADEYMNASMELDKGRVINGARKVDPEARRDGIRAGRLIEIHKGLEGGGRPALGAGQ